MFEIFENRGAQIRYYFSLDFDLRFSYNYAMSDFVWGGGALDSLLFGRRWGKRRPKLTQTFPRNFLIICFRVYTTRCARIKDTNTACGEGLAVLRKIIGKTDFPRDASDGIRGKARKTPLFRGRQISTAGLEFPNY